MSKEKRYRVEDNLPLSNYEFVSDLYQVDLEIDNGVAYWVVRKDKPTLSDVLLKARSD